MQQILHDANGESERIQKQCEKNNCVCMIDNKYELVGNGRGDMWDFF